MKPVGGFIIVFLLFLKVSFGQGEDNSPLDKIISIEARNKSIASVLDQISSLSQVYFSYDPLLVEAERKIDASLTSKSIREVLDVILESRFTYRVLDNQVIITLPGQESGNDSAGELVREPPVIFFHGRVIDHEQKDPLPFTSISVQKSAIGTISNADGDFELKIPGTLIQDTVVVSCMGYRQFRLPVREITLEKVTIFLQPSDFQLQEVRVVYISPEEILRRMESKIYLNYSREPEIMTSFYREVLRQDKHYIDVAEAVMELRKAPYDNQTTEDKVKFVKGRKSMNVKPFQFVDFKIQGGPYYITKLDVVKTMDSFLAPESLLFYKYSLDNVIEQDNRPTFVISFKPKEKAEDIHYQGKLYVDMSSFALVKAEFELSRAGLKVAHQSLIQKKPRGFVVRPTQVEYLVNYRRTGSKWHLSNAQASIQFRVRSKEEKINSLFHSVSELLVTDIKPDEGGHLKRSEVFSSKDIFTEMIHNYDDHFWGGYNIIKPSEDLREALEKYHQENDTLFNSPPVQSDEPQTRGSLTQDSRQ